MANRYAPIVQPHKQPGFERDKKTGFQVRKSWLVKYGATSKVKEYKGNELENGMRGKY